MPYQDPDRRREYQRGWVRRRRDDWLKFNGPCVECGSWDDLEVDHIDGASKVSHKVWSWSELRRLAELAKCQVLCAGCHIAKTNRARPVTMVILTCAWCGDSFEREARSYNAKASKGQAEFYCSRSHATMAQNALRCVLIGKELGCYPRDAGSKPAAAAALGRDGD